MVAGRDKGFYREEGIDLDIKRGFGPAMPSRRLSAAQRPSAPPTWAS
jgi:hypothetical protein